MGASSTEPGPFLPCRLDFLQQCQGKYDPGSHSVDCRSGGRHISQKGLRQASIHKQRDALWQGLGDTSWISSHSRGRPMPMSTPSTRLGHPYLPSPKIVQPADALPSFKLPSFRIRIISLKVFPITIAVGNPHIFIEAQCGFFPAQIIERNWHDAIIAFAHFVFIDNAAPMFLALSAAIFFLVDVAAPSNNAMPCRARSCDARSIVKALDMSLRE